MKPEHKKNCQYEMTKDKQPVLPCTCDYTQQLEFFIDRIIKENEQLETYRPAATADWDTLNLRCDDLNKAIRKLTSINAKLEKEIDVIKKK